MLQPALGNQGTSHQSRESPETPRYFLSNVCLSPFRPTFYLFSSCRHPRLYPPHAAQTHVPTHTHALMLTTWGRCSLAPNVLWRPRSRPLTAAQRMSAPSHTCHTCARVHTLAHTHNTQPRGRCSLAPNVLWRP